MIWTSYIGNRELQTELNCVVVANSMVNRVGWMHDRRLAPPIWLMNAFKGGEITWDRFSGQYKEKVLSRLDPAEIYQKYDGFILLCYEKSNQFCHRRLIAEWLCENGFEAHELGGKG